MKELSELVFENKRPPYYVFRDGDKKVYDIKGDFFFEILNYLPPVLKQKNVLIPLDEIFDVAKHVPTNSIMVSNKGAVLHTKTPITQKDYLTYHIRFGIFRPRYGFETVNVGIVGNINAYDRLIIRSESACAPSFIFGSQRCNCHDQWILARELAGHYNQIEMPDKKGKDLEKFIKDGFEFDQRKFPVAKTGGLAFMLIHHDSQNGMGSGALEEGYNSSLTETAFLRHGGEYTAEQKYDVSMAGGLRALGLPDDPRTTHDSVAYKIAPMILDYFLVNNYLVVLTNNEKKTEALSDFGYPVERIGFFGRADNSSYLETEDRRKEYGHDIPENLEVTFEEEFERVKAEIDRTIDKTLKR